MTSEITTHVGYAELFQLPKPREVDMSYHYSALEAFKKMITVLNQEKDGKKKQALERQIIDLICEYFLKVATMVDRSPLDLTDRGGFRHKPVYLKFFWKEMKKVIKDNALLRGGLEMIQTTLTQGSEPDTTSQNLLQRDVLMFDTSKKDLTIPQMLAEVSKAETR